MLTANEARRGFTLVELLCVVAIMGILVGLLLLAVQSAREKARDNQCLDHLRQMGLAAQTHLLDTNRYPTGGWGPAWMGWSTAGTGAEQPGGWVYNLLPYMEKSDLHDSTNGTSLQTLSDQMIKLAKVPLGYMNCPSRRGPQLYSYGTAIVPFNPLYVPTVEVLMKEIGPDISPGNMVAKSDYAANSGVRYDVKNPQMGTPPGPAATKSLFR